MQPRSFALLIFTAALASCASTESMIRRLPPGALVLAVKPATIQASEGQQEGADLRFTDTGEQVQARLIRTLKELDAASVVVMADEPGAPEPDITISPVVTSASFSYEGIADSWWASGGLWLITWIGGLAVEDSAYRGEIKVDCNFKAKTSEIEFSEAMSNAMVRTTFMERNGFFSWPMLQSLVLPPFWTSDDKESTSQALTNRSTDAIATQIATLIKQRFEERAWSEQDCRLIVAQPETGNGSVVNEPTLNLKLRVLTRDTAVDKMFITVNGGTKTQVENLQTTETPGRLGSKNYTTTADTSIELTKGQNLVRLHFVGATTFSRTLRFGLR